MNCIIGLGCAGRVDNHHVVSRGAGGSDELITCAHFVGCTMWKCIR
jgi:hypothetical protein